MRAAIALHQNIKQVPLQCLAILMMITESRTLTLDVGQSLRLDCEFYMDNFDMFDNPVIWKKRQHGSTTSSQINTMRNIHRPYVGTGRFDVALMAAAPRYRLQLGIANCAREDSGNYTCEVRGKRSSILAAVTHQLYVRAPISKLVITVDNSSRMTSGVQTSLPAVDGRRGPVSRTTGAAQRLVLTFVAGLPLPHVRCIAAGGFPPPGVSLYLGHSDITVRFDIVQRSSLHGLDGLQVLWHETELVAGGEGLVMTENDDGKRLRCVATVDGLPSNVTAATVTVRYAPVVTCPTTTALPGERSVRLRCEIRARPDLSALFWITDVNGTTVAEGTTIDDFWSASMVRSDGVLEAQLHLRHVMPYHFRKYTLVAENSVAMTTHQVQLVRASPSRTVTNNDVTSARYPEVNYARPHQRVTERSHTDVDHRPPPPPRYDVMTSAVTSYFVSSQSVLCPIILLLYTRLTFSFLL